MSSEIEINSLGTETALNESTSFNKETQGSDLPVINIINKQFENKIAENNEEYNFDSVNDNCSNKVKRNKNKIIDDSESEEDISSVIDITQSENEITPVETLNEKRHKRLAIVDSDSEEEAETVTTHNKSFSDDIQSNSEQPVFITNSEGQLIPENINLDKRISQATRLSALCDPESSEDEVDKEKEYKENNRSEESDVIAVQYKKKRKPKEKDVKEPKKMTGKQAAELRTEIKSESQRMLREKNVSLPYHKPKSYTLKEFLSKRPKFSSALPIGVKVPPSVAIKMSTEQLTIVSKKLKEREKEVKQFYKSESESEDDHDDKDYVPPCESKPENNQEMSKELSEEKNVLVTPSDGNKDEENCLQLISTEITSVISDPVDHEAIDEEELNPTENNVSDISFKDCDTDNCTEINDILNNVTDEQEPNQKIRIISNINLTVNYNLIKEDSVHKSLENGDKYEQDMESNTNLTINNEDSIHNNPESCDKSMEDKEVNTFSDTLETNERTEKCSMEYEFNLDGLEENTENILGKECSSENKTTFKYTDLDREIENFGCDNNELPIEQSKNLSKLDLIKESIANIRPKLIGGPDDVIDLDTGVTKPNEVTKLMKRFVEHNFKKAVHKSKVELSIISFESGEIHKETVAMKLEDDSEDIAKEEKPGAKLQKLRDELQNQMAQKRSELWQKKITKQPNNEEENIYDGEKDHCDENDDILDDEEEEMEMTESSEEEEEEGEADDVNEKKKSVFIDEEAEESDEEEAIIGATSEDEVANEGDDENEIGELSECDEDEDEERNQSPHAVNESETQSTNKTFKKILKGFTEDSDEEESENVEKPEDSNIISQEDDDVIPPHQPQSSQTPIRKITQKKSDFDFLTPISYITGLQNLHNSTSKSLKESPVTLFQNLNEPSPLKENNWQQNLQKKLFTGSEVTDSQVEQLYSEQFPETQEGKDSVSPNSEQIANSCNEEFPCTTNSVENEEQLVELCSGKFPSTAELEKRLSDPPPQTQDLLNLCSGEFTGITQNESAGNTENVTKTPYLFNRNTEVKSLDDDQDLIISQIINEEEMEKFKKRFESPLISNTQRRIVEEFEEAVAGGGVIDSDDDTDTVEVKKKNKKRIMFSDDEDSDEDNEEEVIDLHDDIEDEDSNVAPDDIAYDSEENEIELVDDAGGPILKPSDFFENEAELSESEWGSADEDEKDLDTMEFEQGDAENYDEKKIRSDLEKIHMRQLLDDDTRQVKLLQEMLLEDGELHGTGRERQFKWKNIDSVANEDEKKGEEDDFYLEEDESEEQWRKRRHEREMFLKEKLKKSEELDDDSLLSESQLLKIGHKVLQRSQSNSQNNTPIDKNSEVSESPVLKKSFTLLNKRGSFLSRSDQVLQRLAEYSKVTSTTLGTATAKNSRNFLFQTVTVGETSVGDKQNKKRKAADGTPNVIKRLRLSNNLSPAVKKKPNTKTKLFGNW